MSSPAKLMRRSHGQIGLSIHRQPDDPGTGVCPHCGCRCRPSQEVVALKLLRMNAGRVPVGKIATALNWSVGKLSRFAASHRIDINCRPEPEQEPRGA